ncbi:MAG: FtsQ-type POTRA domain-containing protein [Treponema sp.]|nr:FtsQ-type POTRA domain-containing protein [Treponema sp.]
MREEYIVNDFNPEDLNRSDLDSGVYTRGRGLRFSGVSVPGRKIEKGLKRLLIIAAIILGAEFIWLAGISPCIPLSAIDVQSFPGFDKAAVLAYAGISDKSSFVSVNAGETEKILASCYLVEQARVVKRFPDRLSIFLAPRKAVALAMADVDGSQAPVYFDRHGVVFKIGNAAGEVFQNTLPVISGLVIQDASLGMQLPASLVPFLTELAGIEEKAPELLAAISEIKVNRRPYDGFDLVLYPVHSPVRVRLGNSISEETLRYVMVILDVFDSQPVKPAEIDFRSIISPYTVKEVPSG